MCGRACPGGSNRAGCRTPRPTPSPRPTVRPSRARARGRRRPAGDARRLAARTAPGCEYAGSVQVEAASSAGDAGPRAGAEPRGEGMRCSTPNGATPLPGSPAAPSGTVSVGAAGARIRSPLAPDPSSHFVRALPGASPRVPHASDPGRHDGSRSKPCRSCAERAGTRGPPLACAGPEAAGSIGPAPGCRADRRCRGETVRLDRGDTGARERGVDTPGPSARGGHRSRLPRFAHPDPVSAVPAAAGPGRRRERAFATASTMVHSGPTPGRTAGVGPMVRVPRGAGAGARPPSRPPMRRTGLRASREVPPSVVRDPGEPATERRGGSPRPRATAHPKRVTRRGNRPPRGYSLPPATPGSRRPVGASRPAPVGATPAASEALPRGPAPVGGR